MDKRNINRITGIIYWKLLVFIRDFLFLLLLFFYLNDARAQKEANTWYFGNHAGVDFNSVPPVALNNGALLTEEGCSAVSDANGNLLFYTDGMTVWNASHLVMTNGFGLHGASTSDQSALIVRLPGSQVIYYIFTVYNNFEYSIVDMSLSAGMGAVTVKNSTIMSNCHSEKQCGTFHANGFDVWIMMHEGGSISSNGFNAFLLGASGLNLTPVHTNTGLLQTFGPGAMKFSPDGSHVAVSSINAVCAVEIFDFDNATGIVSNAIAVPTSFGQSYSLEFSPDNSKLYCTTNYSVTEIRQFDLKAGAPAAVIASETIISTQVNMQFGSMQLAPDDRIYISTWNRAYLSVIEDPNVKGTNCNFVLNGLFLNGDSTYYGLPAFVSTYFSLFPVINSCLGDSTYFDIGNTSALFGTIWNFGDPVSGTDNISYDYTPSHYYSAGGSYSVEIIRYFNNGSIDTAYQQVNIHTPSTVFIGSDTIICSGDSIMLYAGPGFAGYIWQDGSTDSSFMASDSGIYYVTVTDGICAVSDSMHVSTQPCAMPIAVLASSDTMFCDKQCIDFFDLSTNNPSSWQWFFPGADSTYSTLQNPTNICYNSYGSFDVTLIACNAIGCDTLVLPGFINEFHAPALPSVTINDDTLFCSTAFSYQWYDADGAIAGATGQFYVYFQPGSYYVIITDSNGCAASSGFIYTGIVETGSSMYHLLIFPNPSDGNFTFIPGDIHDGQIRLSIYDITGRLILAKNQDASDHHLFIKAAGGIYVVEATLGEKTYRCRLVINGSK